MHYAHSIAENAILESNSIMHFVRPDLYLSVLDTATADFKLTAQQFLDRADGLVLHDEGQVAWSNVSLKPVAKKPVFRMTPPQYVTPELVEFVRNKLEAKSARPRG